MKEYTLEEVSEHNTQDDAWIVLEGLVYDITDFLEDPSQHPGGIILIIEHLGEDITVCLCAVWFLILQKIFHDADVHAHSPKAIEQLKLYHIGSLKS